MVEGNVGLGQTEIRSEQETEMMAQKDAKRSRGRQRQIDRVWEKCISPQSLQFCNKQANPRHILTYALKSDFFRLRKTKSRTRPHRKSQNQENIQIFFNVFHITGLGITYLSFLTIKPVI